MSSQDLPQETIPIFASGIAADAAVDAVGAGEGLGGETLVVVEPGLLGDGRVVEPDVEAALGHGEVGRA